jgi:hypothetical protein
MQGARKPVARDPGGETTPEDRAIDLLEEAWESGAAKGQKLALQALELWPDCIEGDTPQGDEYYTPAFAWKGSAQPAQRLCQHLFLAARRKCHLGKRQIRPKNPRNCSKTSMERCKPTGMASMNCLRAGVKLRWRPVWLTPGASPGQDI